MCLRYLSRLRLRQIHAVVCAVTYLGGGMELLPQMLAVGASIEASHAVHFNRTNDRIQIVLCHRCEHPDVSKPAWSCPSKTGPHRHGAASRVFCLFVDPTQPRPDHVASFAASSLCENRAERVAANSKTPTAGSPALALPAPFHPSELAEPDFAKPTSIGPPPSLSRSTVLLI